MSKRILFFVALWTLSDSVYINRMAISRMRAPVAFRPGVVLPRPIYPQRISATRRTPYIVYRNTPHRYAMKHISGAPTRNINPFNSWKTTRLPLPTTEYEFIRPSSPTILHPDGTAVDINNSVQSFLNVGAIHTIPAPNLSLLEKPIVVADASENRSANITSEGPKPTYEVTEKYLDQPIYQTNAKIESPIGFSKASSMSAEDLQNIVRHNAALQLASEYGFPAIQLSQPPIQFSEPTVQLPQTLIPQQFSMQGFHGIAHPQEFMHRTPESIIIPPNAIYQQDPMFLHKLQGQILQQYPSVEFIPYTPNIQSQVKTQSPETQTSLFLLQNEQITKQIPSAFVVSDQKHIVQRETQEGTISSMISQAFSNKNVSENLVEIDVTTTTTPFNKTETLPTETQAPTTTAENSAINDDEYKTTPIYYAQIGQSVGNVIANGFYSAINDVRAASLDAENILKDNTTTTTASTTTQREVKSVIMQSDIRDTKIEDLKNLLGAPFEKTAESVNVAYTLLRASEKEPKVNEDGEVFAGQLVEAKISEDQEFNKEKATLANRPQLRLFAVKEKRGTESPQRTVVKAKIPPKSKLTFDDKTGEPVLRVYASYVDSQAQKDLLTAKLTNMKPTKEATRKQDTIEWTTDTKSTETSDDFNQAFGLKLRSRRDN